DSVIENIIGSAHNDTLTGNARNNTITRNAGNDSLSGGAGDDTYRFWTHGTSLGSDTVIEASDIGTDTFDFSDFVGGVSVDLSSTESQVVAMSLLTLTLNSATAIENVGGSIFNDTIIGNARDNLIRGAW